MTSFSSPFGTFPKNVPQNEEQENGVRGKSKNLKTKKESKKTLKKNEKTKNKENENPKTKTATKVGDSKLLNFEFDNAFLPTKNLLNSKKSSRSEEEILESDPRYHHQLQVQHQLHHQVQPQLQPQPQTEILSEKGKKGKDGKEGWVGSFLGGLSEQSKDGKPVRRRKKLNECDVSPHVQVSCQYGREVSWCSGVCSFVYVIRAHTHMCTHTLIHTHTNSLSLSLSHTHTHSTPNTHTHTHTRTGV